MKTAPFIVSLILSLGGLSAAKAETGSAPPPFSISSLESVLEDTFNRSLTNEERMSLESAMIDLRQLTGNTFLTEEVSSLTQSMVVEAQAGPGPGTQQPGARQQRPYPHRPNVERRPSEAVYVVLFCGSANGAFFVNGRGGICVDSLGRKYSLTGIGLGVGTELAGELAVLLIRSFESGNVTGRYVGAGASATAGFLGAGGGLFFKRQEVDGSMLRANNRNQVYLLAYKAGAGMDVSVKAIVIDTYKGLPQL